MKSKHIGNEMTNLKDLWENQDQICNSMPGGEIFSIRKGHEVPARVPVHMRATC